MNKTAAWWAIFLLLAPAQISAAPIQVPSWVERRFHPQIVQVRDVKV